MGFANWEAGSGKSAHGPTTIGGFWFLGPTNLRRNHTLGGGFQVQSRREGGFSFGQWSIQHHLIRRLALSRTRPE
jgi:hypothetical protein